MNLAFDTKTATRVSVTGGSCCNVKTKRMKKSVALVISLFNFGNVNIYFHVLMSICESSKSSVPGEKKISEVCATF